MSNSLPPLPPNDGQFQFPIWKWFNDLRTRFAELAARVTKLETGDSVLPEDEGVAVTVFPLTEIILWATPGTYQYTYPYDCDVVVNVIAAGGSGGRGFGANRIGTGGGAGERRFVRFRAAAGEVSTIIVGAGGSAAFGTISAGGVDGETSEFQHPSKGVSVVSDGGKGGRADSSLGDLEGGAGGSAGQGGDVAYPGGRGGSVFGGSGERATGGGAVAITEGNFNGDDLVAAAGAASDGASAVQERGAFFIPMSALYNTGGAAGSGASGGDGGDYSGGGGALATGGDNGGDGGVGAGGGGATGTVSIRAGNGGDGAVIIWHSGPI